VSESEIQFRTVESILICET